MATIKQLEDELSALSLEVAQKQYNLEMLKSAPENHVYASLEDAEYVLTDLLGCKAFRDCEGAYHVGNPEYQQEFIVDGKHYMATMTFEYNRHDKTYYYVEESDYSYKELP